MEELVRAIAQRAGCTLLEINITITNELIKNKELTVLAEAIDSGNVIGVVYGVDKLIAAEQQELSKVLVKIRDNKWIKGLLILTSAEPWNINTELKSAICLTLRQRSAKGNDILYDEY